MDFFFLLPYETLHWHKQAHSLSKKLYFFLYTTAAVLKSSQKLKHFTNYVSEIMTWVKQGNEEFFFSYVNNAKNINFQCLKDQF